jgi:hypothetical protein
MTQTVVNKRHDDITKDRDSLSSRSIAFRDVTHSEVAHGGECLHEMENEVHLLFWTGSNTSIVALRIVGGNEKGSLESGPENDCASEDQ